MQLNNTLNLSLPSSLIDPLKRAARLNGSSLEDYMKQYCLMLMLEDITQAEASIQK